MLKIRNIIALYIATLMLPIVLCIFNYCANLDFNYQEVADEIAINQLRRILLLSYNQEYENNYIFFKYQNNEFYLHQIDNNLVLSNGYQLFLSDIDYVEFTNDGLVLSIKYQRGNKEYEKVIAESKRLCIDDFYQCDVSVPESDDGF